MPLLRIETNQSLKESEIEDLLETATSLVAKQLRKSADYVMVRFSHNPSMLLAGNRQPLAWLQLNSIELPEVAVPELSAALCDLVESRLKVPPNRTYIEFVATSRKMWGYNGGTF